MDGDKMFFEKEVKILMVDFVGLEKTVKVMSYAKGLAKFSNNPIAKAIYNLDPRIETAKVEKEKEFKDFGITGTAEGNKILLGNEKIMKENNIKLNGDTAHKIFFAINDQVQAVFRLND
jgi:Cd2+/Zn2+-exporting ATPase